MIRRPPRSTLSSSSAASDVYKRQILYSEVEKYYKKANIVIVTSVWPEPFGLIGSEAMSVGRPVIGTKVGGIPEWLEDGETGYLVEPGDPKQIAENVIKLLSDRKLMEKIGRNAMEKAKRFNIKKHVEEIEKVYKNVIAVSYTHSPSPRD